MEFEYAPGLDQEDSELVDLHVTDRSNSRLPSDFKIVHAAETSGGGIATYLSYLIRMQRQRFGAGAVSVMLPKSQCHYLELPSGVEMITFDDRSGRLRNAFRLAGQLREYVAQAQPAVVHLHSTFAGAVLRPMLSLRGRARIIYCPHGWAFDRRMNDYAKHGVRWVERRLSKLCDAIVCVSQHEVRTARSAGIKPENLVLVRNGVPAVAPEPTTDPAQIDWPEGRRRLLFVGRFDRQKGVDVLLRAAARLRDRVFVCLVGGSVVGDLSLGSLPDNVRVCGYLSTRALQSYYQSCEIVVIPSRWEGFGLVAAEAMRAGRAVIASNVGGLSEQVEDGVTGFLIPPDNEKALVQILRGLSPEQSRAMGILGRQRFLKDFTMERTHRQLCDLYAAICKDERTLTSDTAGLG
jgi:glycosyltransferase involved in cell wall biosynthesis